MSSATILALCLAVLGLVHFAQAGPCPTSICAAAFGSVDCCTERGYYPKFALGTQCQWYNNPVSFFNEGTCEGKGKKFLLLRPSNHQGPASNSLCRCKDPYVPVPVTKPVTKPAIPRKVQGFNVVSYQDIVGSDIPCDGKSFCEVCGPLQSIVDRCNAGFKSTKCVAFTYDGKCGYLKKSKSPVKYREGWIKYTKA